MYAKGGLGSLGHVHMGMLVAQTKTWTMEMASMTLRGPLWMIQS